MCKMNLCFFFSKLLIKSHPAVKSSELSHKEKDQLNNDLTVRELPVF